MSHCFPSVLVRVSLLVLVPCHLFGRLQCHVKPLDSFYEWEITNNRSGDLCLHLGLTIGFLRLKIPRVPTQATILVIRKLFPKQKATFWTTIYLCVVHAERSRDFLAFVQGFRQTMTIEQRVTMFYQIDFKA